MSTLAAAARSARHRTRRRRLVAEAGLVLVGIMLLIWSLVPIYNLFLIALDPEEGEVEFTGNIWPPEPSLDAFWVVLSQGDRYLAHFWQQFGNSVFIGFSTMVLTALIASLASFAAGRLWPAKGALLTNAALLTYLVPAAFLTVPFYQVMNRYGLANSRWAVVAAMVTFATPFAILVLRHYASLIPREFDEAARIDGATNLQVYRLVYLPLVAPALAVVAMYSLLLAWSDYLYQFTLLSSQDTMTVAMMQGHLFEDPDAAWNAMMAAAIIYALPPIAIFWGLRRYVMRGLALGGRA